LVIGPKKKGLPEGFLDKPKPCVSTEAVKAAMEEERDDQ